MYKCNQNYQKIGDPITLNNFNIFLKGKYLIINKLTFRSIVNRYFRVYGRENDDEILPLRTAKSESLSTSIISIIKLFELYRIIEKNIEAEKESSDKKNSFSYFTISKEKQKFFISWLYFFAIICLLV